MLDWTPDQLKESLDNGSDVFLKLWKPGCGACKLSESATRRLEDANEHQLIFGAIDVDQFPEMLSLAEVETIPVFFVFRQKEMKGKVIGFKGINKLKSMIDEAFES
jgi:thiol-disulfide isomerase/thioredoxin